MEIVLGTGEATKFGLRTLVMEISLEISISRGEIFTSSAVPRAGKVGGDSHKSIEGGAGMILLGIIPDLLL